MAAAACSLVVVLQTAGTCHNNQPLQIRVCCAQIINSRRLHMCCNIQLRQHRADSAAAAAAASRAERARCHVAEAAMAAIASVLFASSR